MLLDPKNKTQTQSARHRNVLQDQGSMCVRTKTKERDFTQKGRKDAKTTYHHSVALGML